MFAAQLHAKLTRAEEHREDLLTSNVFGVWCYLPAELGLVQFLETARNLDGNGITGIGQVVDAKPPEFWPTLAHPGCNPAEPDVLIEVTCSDNSRILLLIESKYLSAKSSTRDASPLPMDQLGKEMRLLRKEAEYRHVNRYALVYVTAHTHMPKEELDEAIDELIQKKCDADRERFFWTTWRCLPSILADNRLVAEARKVSPGHARMLDDLRQILCGLEPLASFECIHTKGWTLGDPPWRFVVPDIVFRWFGISMRKHGAPIWRFGHVPPKKKEGWIG